MSPPTSSQLINPSTAYSGTFHNKRNGSCINIRSGYDGLYLKEHFSNDEYKITLLQDIKMEE
jgi:hypothetical protein